MKFQIILMWSCYELGILENIIHKLTILWPYKFLIKLLIFIINLYWIFFLIFRILVIVEFFFYSLILPLRSKVNLNTLSFFLKFLSENNKMKKKKKNCKVKIFFIMRQYLTLIVNMIKNIFYNVSWYLNICLIQNYHYIIFNIFYVFFTSTKKKKYISLKNKKNLLLILYKFCYFLCYYLIIKYSQFINHNYSINLLKKF